MARTTTFDAVDNMPFHLVLLAVLFGMRRGTSNGRTKSAQVTHSSLPPAAHRTAALAASIMAPSLTADALASSLEAQESSQNHQSPPSSCGSDDDRQEELEHLGVADTVLNDDNWSWLRDLLDPVRDAAVRKQGKILFARLFKAGDAAQMDVALSAMETWRDGLGHEKARPREHELARALFLLGYDKSMSLSR
ncbi:unnamed protein product [Phytophthora lilii]|uniref:Unnamed protein product n=1 Tax=Phytophthora lilii TaxID=2077276 RepID=A0A9W6X0H7_9STRA|nr:unnamed protein product [Phytophthora lilii]